MLIEFRVANFRSIAEEQVISLVPEKGRTEFPSNIISIGKHSGLNALAFYGANSSGKSNLLRAFYLLNWLLYDSTNRNSSYKLPYEPNLLIEGYSSIPTKLEIVFVASGNRYRYGLEFGLDKVHSEWLFRKKIGREVELFFREGEVIDVSSGFNASNKLIEAAIEGTRDNALFLSLCDIFNIQEAKLIFKWFDNFIYVDGLKTEKAGRDTLRLCKSDENFQKRINEFLKGLDLNILGLEVDEKEFSPSMVPKEIDEDTRNAIIRSFSSAKNRAFNTLHKTYKNDGSEGNDSISWRLSKHESRGTQKIIQLGGPILYTLIHGGVIIVDEIEAKLHTKITLAIVELFLSRKTNPLNAQILFATHDTNLLKLASLRRDQINLVEKDKKEATELFALSDFRYFNGNKERPDTDKEKRYLEGRYGATPRIHLEGDLLFSK